LLTPTKDSVHDWKIARNLTSPLGALEAFSAVTRFSIGEPIYLCGDSAHFWYRILSGAGRQCGFALDGSRQIVDFLRPGDFFGYDAQEMHTFCVEAITRDTTVARYPRRHAERIADSDPFVARRIRELAFESTSRVQQRMLILGRGSAREKISGFLLEMAERFRAASTGSVILPMSRYDIADYLAMAVETVSRELSSLRERGVVEFEAARRIRIRERTALEHAGRDSINVGAASKIMPVDCPRGDCNALQ